MTNRQLLLLAVFALAVGLLGYAAQNAWILIAAGSIPAGVILGWHLGGEIRNNRRR